MTLITLKKQPTAHRGILACNLKNSAKTIIYQSQKALKKIIQKPAVKLQKLEPKPSSHFNALQAYKDLEL